MVRPGDERVMIRSARPDGVKGAKTVNRRMQPINNNNNHLLNINYNLYYLLTTTGILSRTRRTRCYIDVAASHRQHRQHASDLQHAPVARADCISNPKPSAPYFIDEVE